MDSAIRTDSPAAEGRIALALSGGGNRAALFGLGAMLYLVDSSINESVCTIVSVSGGSWLNALVGLTCDFRTVDSKQFDQIAARPLAKLITRDQIPAEVFATALGFVMLAHAWAAYLLLANTSHSTATKISGLVLAFFGGGALAGSVFARFRHFIHARSIINAALTALRSQDNTRKATIKSRPYVSDLLHPSIRHVICATDLEAGDFDQGRQIYFSASDIYSTVYGWGLPQAAPLDRILAASSAFPFVFSAVTLKAAKLEFDRPPVHRRLKLVDGGVNDNLGLPWFALTDVGESDLAGLIVVNSSVKEDAYRRLRWLSFVRSAKILHASNIAARLRAIQLHLNPAIDSQAKRDRIAPKRGAVISIGDTVTSALEDARNVAGEMSDPAEQDRLLRRINKLEGVIRERPWSRPDGRTWQLAGRRGQETTWERICRDANSVPTTPFRIRSHEAEKLLLHGYILTMIATHLYLDNPLAPLRSLRDLRDLRLLITGSDEAT